MRYFLFTFSLFIIVGCSQQPTPTESQGLGTATSDGAVHREVHLEPSTSLDALRDNFKLAYENGDVNAIESLMHWGNASDEDKSLFMKLRIGVHDAGVNRLSHLEMRPVVKGEFESGVHTTSLEPTHVFEFTSTSPDGGSSTKARVPVTKVGEEYKMGVLITKQRS